MFISKQEQFDLTLRVTRLESRIEQLARSLNAVLDAQTMASASNIVTPPKVVKPLAEAKPKKKKDTSGWTLKKRIEQGKRISKMWADKKAQAAAAAAKTSTPAN